MSLDHLPSNIEQGVQRIANELHIPRDEALLKVIETGISTIRLSPAATLPTREERQARLDLVTELRAQKGKARAPLRTDNPEKIIGLFGDAPELVDSILQVVEERSQRYAEPGK